MLEEALKEKGFIITTAKGISMMPLIRSERDNIVLKVPKTAPKKYDVVLYKRKNGAYILHRILEVRSNDYVLCGDNQVQKEYGIQREQILGVLDGIYRGNTYINLDSKCYRVYVWVWCHFIWIRRLGIFGYKVWKKIRRCNICYRIKQIFLL